MRRDLCIAGLCWSLAHWVQCKPGNPAGLGFTESDMSLITTLLRLAGILRRIPES